MPRKAFPSDARYHTDPKYRKAVLARGAAWRKANPEQVIANNGRNGRRSKLERKGWSLESYAATAEKQEHRCAICGILVLGQKLCADHAHTVPPQPRELLCSQCNVGLGNFKERPQVLEAAAAYLRKWAEPEPWGGKDVPVMVQGIQQTKFTRGVNMAP